MPERGRRDRNRQREDDRETGGAFTPSFSDAIYSATGEHLFGFVGQVSLEIRQFVRSAAGTAAPEDSTSGLHHGKFFFTYGTFQDYFSFSTSKQSMHMFVHKSQPGIYNDFAADWQSQFFLGGPPRVPHILPPGIPVPEDLGKSPFFKKMLILFDEKDAEKDVGDCDVFPGLKGTRFACPGISTKTARNLHKFIKEWTSFRTFGGFLRRRPARNRSRVPRSRCRRETRNHGKRMCTVRNEIADADENFFRHTLELRVQTRSRQLTKISKGLNFSLQMLYNESFAVPDSPTGTARSSGSECGGIKLDEGMIHAETAKFPLRRSLHEGVWSGEMPSL